MKIHKALIPLFISLTLAMPAMAQIGLGDVISIIGGSQRQNAPYMGRDRGNDKLQTAIGIASILYQMHQRQQSQHRYPPEYPGYPSDTGYYPPQQPGYYPPQQPAYYPPQQPYDYPPQSGGLVRPDGYSYITSGGRPIRLDPSILPLSINPGSGRHAGIVQQAVDTWNGAGQGQLFELTSGDADLTIDWSGSAVSPGARAETRMVRSSSRVVPTELSVRTGGRSADQLARVLTHELGHVLGLDHSQHQADVMYKSEQNRPSGLTQRDQQMLHWLYSQSSYTPVLGRTDVGGGAVAGRYNSFNGGSFGAEAPTSVCNLHSSH